MVPPQDKSSEIVDALRHAVPSSRHDRAQTERIEALYEMVEAVSRAEALEEIYQQALHSLKRIAEPDRASILLLDEIGVMRFVSWQGLSEDYRQAVEGHSPWDSDDPDPRPVLVPNVHQEPDLAHFREVFRSEGIGALAFIPLVAGRRLLGKFMLYFDQAHELALEELRAVEAIADHIAFAIDRRRAEDALRASEERSRLALAGTETGSWEWDVATDRILWSEQLGPLYGLKPGAQPNGVDEFLELIHPDDRSRFRETIERALEDGSDYAVEYRVNRPDGGQRWLHARAHIILDPSGRPNRVIGLKWDVSERRTREEQARFLSDASLVLGRSLDLQSTLKELAGLAVQQVADWCLVMVLGDDGTASTTALAHADPGMEARGRPFLEEFPIDLEAGQGIGQVVRTGQAVLYSRVDPDLLRASARGDHYLQQLSRFDIGSVMIAPLPGRDRVLGALILVAAQPGRYGPTDLAFAEEFGRRAGLVLDNALLYQAEQRTRQALEQAEDQLRFLAEASELLTRSLDYEDTLQALAGLIVPRLADWCTINLIAERGQIVRVAALHQDPAKQAALDRLLDVEPQDPEADTRVAQTIRSGRSQLLATVGPEVLERAGGAYGEVIEELGMGSCMIVPLTVSGRTIGAMSLVAKEPNRYHAESLTLAETLARRAAIAVDNARTFRERAHIAHTLQRSLLPPYLPSIPGVELSARYLAEGEGHEVGGDFYDLFKVPEGWVMVVGDVEGKGAEAAAVVGFARHTIHAAAMHHPSPRHALEVLNSMMLEQEFEQSSTVVCGRIQMLEDRLRLGLASAGHPPPLILRRDGTVEVVEIPGVMLGVFENPQISELAIDLTPGDTAVFYTDGLFAPEGPGPDELIERLRGRAAASADKLTAELQQMAEEHQPSGLRDDLALLALKVKATDQSPAS